jgi:hypothetical protein
MVRATGLLEKTKKKKKKKKKKKREKERKKERGRKEEGSRGQGKGGRLLPPHMFFLYGSVCQETGLREKWTRIVGVVMVGRRQWLIYVPKGDK